MPGLSDVKTTLERSVLRAAMALPAPVMRRLAGRPVVIDGQRLSTQVQLQLRLQRLSRTPSAAEGTPAAGRERLRRTVAATAGATPVGSVRSLQVAGQAARLYAPTTAAGPGPLLVFFHGGGFFCGNLDSHDGACRLLAERSGVRVLSVEYRLSPEHPFPAAHDDVLAAYAWVVEHLDALEATSVGVGGDSAGGNLAIHVAGEAARQGWPCAAQLLIYPITHPGHPTRSASLFDQGFYLDRYFLDVADERLQAPHDDPRIAAIAAPLPDGLAPAVVVTAGFDPLRDEGEAYAERFRAAGVPVTTQRFEGLIHGFLHLDACSTDAHAALSDIAGLLQEALPSR